MGKPIKIGFLSSYSSIYPEFNQDIIEGFVTAFETHFNGEKLFEFIPEYIKQGGVKAVTEAVKKLLHFDQVDIISGLISYQVIPDLIPLIESRKKIAFFYDLGEYIPNSNAISNHIFFNSFQLWQTEYALGYWAYKEFGDKGAVIMPLYEAGYQMHAAFRQGTISAGSAEIDYHVLPYIPGQSQVSHHLDQVLALLKEKRPSFIHALFSGSEATEFIERYYQFGLNNEIPLLISSHMASEDLLVPVQHLGGQMYTASLWNSQSENGHNQKFVGNYRKFTGKKENPYTLLGYEAGLAFKELLPELSKRDWPKVIELLKKEVIVGPRGEVSFFPESGFALPIIDIEKLSLQNSGIQKIVVDQGRGLKFNNQVFDEIHRETVSGWQNPYLCV